MACRFGGMARHSGANGRCTSPVWSTPSAGNRPSPRPSWSFFLKLLSSFRSELVERQAFSSTLLWGTLICFALWILGAMAASNLMPFYMVLLLGSLAVLAKATE